MVKPLPLAFLRLPGRQRSPGLAKREGLHDKGEQFQISFRGPPPVLDDNLRAMYHRAPTTSRMRSQINKQQVRFTDLHLSTTSDDLLRSFRNDVAVIEAVENAADGRVYLSLPSEPPHIFNVCR